MIFMGHLGTTLWAGRRLGGGELGLKAAAALGLCALLPDLLDKPLFWLDLAPQTTGRLWGHTLIFSLVWCLVCRRWLPAFWPWALAVPGHLALDFMWLEPQTLLWPFLGWDFFAALPPGLSHLHPLAFWGYFWQTQPLKMSLVLAGELAGLVLGGRELASLGGQVNWRDCLHPRWPVIETQQPRHRGLGDKYL